MIDTNEYLSDALKFLTRDAKETKRKMLVNESENKEEELDEESPLQRMNNGSTRKSQIPSSRLREEEDKEDDVDESFENPTSLGQKMMDLWDTVENKSEEEKRNALRYRIRPFLSKFTFATYEDLEDNNYHSLNRFVTDLLGGYDKWIKTQNVKEEENKEDGEDLEEIDEDGKIVPLRKRDDKESLISITASESVDVEDDEKELDEASGSDIISRLKALVSTAKGSVSVEALKDILGSSTIAKESKEHDEHEQGETKEEEEDEDKKENNIQESLRRVASLIV